MKKVYKHKESRKLQIGETYDFYILKKIKLPDKTEYYVMQDLYGEKHLLPFKLYKQYQIKEQDFYPCKVEKVNCQGRMFFEPMHPLYIVGNEYLFCFDKYSFLISKKGIMTEYFLMKGKTGEPAYLNIEPNIKLQKGVYKMYKVAKIKKARIFIEKS